MGRPKRKSRTDETGIDIPEAVDADKPKIAKSVSGKKVSDKEANIMKVAEVCGVQLACLLLEA